MIEWLVIAMLGSQAAPPPTPAILSPSGKWTVDYADSMCLLQRDYGTGSGQVTLGFRPLPLSEQNEVVLVTRADDGPISLPRFDKASLHLGVGGPVIAGTYKYWGSSKMPALRYTQISLVDARVEDIAVADPLIIDRTKLPTVRIRPMATPAAFAALKACQDDLLKSWGIDLAERAKIVTPAVGTRPGEWIQADDYPRDSIKAGERGAVSILWTIGTDGSVSNCRVTQTSGYALLDQAACNAILRRGHYKAALDVEGKPIRSYGSRKVVWKIP